MAGEKRGSMKNHYLNSLLGENEKTILVTRQHWFVLLSAIMAEFIITLILLAALIAATLLLSPLAAIGFILVLLPLGSMAWDVMKWTNREYIVTNRRVIQVAGVFNKNVIDSSLEKVNDVKMSQSFFGRMFNYGDVEILTASELGVNLFNRIGDPVHFKTAMLNAKEKMGFNEDYSRASISDDIPGMIAKLDELRKQGILTEEEFTQKKALLLAKL